MPEVIFKNRKLNEKKMLSFGFAENDDGYAYSCDLISGQMKVYIIVSHNNQVRTRVIDNSTGEEYILHRVPGAVGAFVGQVKAEYEAVLEEISEKCFEPDVFKSAQAKRIISYVRKRYGDELEFLWKNLSDNAVWRRKDTQKWYAAMLTVSKGKLGFNSDEMIEIIDLRARAESVAEIIDNKKYFPGYHMNKKHWITICLDGSVQDEEICNRIDESYELAIK